MEQQWVIVFCVVGRKVEEIKTKHVSTEVSYYVTNQLLQEHGIQAENMAAIRQHWGIESWHWIRDVHSQKIK